MIRKNWIRPYNDIVQLFREISDLLSVPLIAKEMRKEEVNKNKNKIKLQSIIHIRLRLNKFTLIQLDTELSRR
jgi:hypothetical protein